MIIPLLDENYWYFICLVDSIFLITISLINIIDNFSAFNLTLLGWGALIFFDIFKFYYNNLDTIKTDDSYSVTILMSFLGFIIYITSTILFRFNNKLSNSFVKISNFKFNYIVVPISLAISSLLLVFSEFQNENLFFLLSFIPKTILIVLVYLYFNTRKKIYLILFIIFSFSSYFEISRRIYLTIIFSIIPIVISYFYLKNNKITKQFKAISYFSIILIFVFMNYLRSDYEYGEGYIENNKLLSTYNYTIQFKALDTFDNTNYVIKSFPDKFDYYYGETYLATFFQMIPRSLWPGKIVGFGAPLAQIRYGGSANFDIEFWKNSINGLTLSPGFIGEAYANFGFMGIILASAMLGIAVNFFDHNINSLYLYKNSNYIKYTPFYSSFFLILRGDFVMATYFSLLYFLFLSLILNFIKK